MTVSKGIYLTILMIVALVAATEEDKQHRGIQMRVTDKGLDYAVKLGIAIMEKDLDGKVIPLLSGSAKHLVYSVENAHIEHVVVKGYRLQTVANQGLQVGIADMSLKLKGRLHYKFHWLISISDTVNIEVDVKGLSLMAGFSINAQSEGKPSVTMTDCKPKINDLDLHFSGSGSSFIYKIITSAFSGTLKKKISELMCKEAKEQISKHANEEIKTFPVVHHIDKWASIDYRMMSSPLFTSTYMDSFIKGKFMSRTSPYSTKLRVPVFNTSSDASKMVYFWLTDYTLNTAGEVYHKSGAFQFTITKEDKDVPLIMRQFMSTSTLKLFFPQLYKAYPKMPLRFILTSYKAPVADVAADGISLKLFVKAGVQAYNATMAADVFSLALDVIATGTISMKNERLTGSITHTSFNMSVVGSTIGKINIPVNVPIVRMLINFGILKQVNPILERGMPLPKVDDISFKNSSILLQKDVIRIGTDFQYKPESPTY